MQSKSLASSNSRIYQDNQFEQKHKKFFDRAIQRKQEAKDKNSNLLKQQQQFQKSEEEEEKRNQLNSGEEPDENISASFIIEPNQIYQNDSSDQSINKS